VTEVTNQTVGESSDVVIDTTNELGYSRSASRQEQFEQAVAALRRVDCWTDPVSSKELLNADLVLEGGGVKGIGLVGAVLVLSEAGYTFPRVAGTSAGAIAAVLIASISKAGKPMTSLKSYLGSLDFKQFMQTGRVAHWIEDIGAIGKGLVGASELMRKMGLYSGDYLAEWLGPILADDLGVTTFKDLKISPADDPGMSLPAEHQYRVVVHTSDITRAELVRLPWDFNYYGLERDNEQVVRAVRASMSIPFFFEPVIVQANPATVTIPGPGLTRSVEHYGGGSVTWVDGGMLANFPIDAFDRVDSAPPRWPTIGIKLSAQALEMPKTVACHDTSQEAMRCLRTMMNEWDRYHVDQTTAARTIFVENLGLSATQFELTTQQQDELFLSGVRAATAFLIEMSAIGGVPRTVEQARRLAGGQKH
jgi:NTE family protein